VIRLRSSVEGKGRDVVAFDFVSALVISEHGVSKAPMVWPASVGEISGIMQSIGGPLRRTKNFRPLN
jgi:hypothetical protein